jgi:hypothetical protein
MGFDFMTEDIAIDLGTLIIHFDKVVIDSGRQ